MTMPGPADYFQDGWGLMRIRKRKRMWEIAKSSEILLNHSKILERSTPFCLFKMVGVND